MVKPPVLLVIPKCPLVITVAPCMARPVSLAITLPETAPVNMTCSDSYAPMSGAEP